MIKLLPGVEIKQRELYFYLIADVSSSMRGASIQSLNYAMSQVIPQLSRLSQNNAGNNAPIYVRAMKFDQNAEWVDADLVSIEEYEWKDLTVGMGTFIGNALLKLCEEFEGEISRKRILAPVVVLISDGYSSDDYKPALSRLLSGKVGRSAVKVAIAIGDDTDDEMLKEFIANPDIPILRADSSDKIINYITWASLSAVKSSITGKDMNAQSLTEADLCENALVLFDA